MQSHKKKQRHVTDKVACIILAGGQGTRLHPLTHTRCKPAVMFGGHYRLVDIPISNALNAEFRNIYVLAQYFSSGLNNHITKTFNMDQYQGSHLTMLTPEETPDGKIWFDGTADAVRKNVSYFLESPIEYFIILSGDQLYNMDLNAMLHFAKEKDADLTVACLPVGKEEAPRMGLMKVNDAFDIVDFKEKPKEEAVLEEFSLKGDFVKKHKISSDPAFLASMGIYIFKKEVLIKLLQEDTREDFGKHLIPTQMSRGKTAAFLYNGYWEDIGTVKSFYEANLALTRNDLNLNLYDEASPIYSHAPPLPCPRIVGTKITDSILCHGSVVLAKEVTNSIIGVRAQIGEHSVIRDSIIQGNQFYESPTESLNFTIGNNCIIQKTIIDENVQIGNNVKLVNEHNLQTYDGDGVYIRDGIIVVGSNTTLPDNFTL